MYFPLFFGVVMYYEIQFFSYYIPTFTIIYAIAYFANIFQIYYLTKKLKIDFNKIFNLFHLGILVSFIFARVGGEFIFNNNFNLIEIFSYPKGENSVIGGIFGIGLVLIFFPKIFKIKASIIIKIFLPVILLFHFLGKLACNFAGCCYGIYTDLFFGIPSSFAIDLLDKNQKIFPIQILESFFYLLGLILYIKIFNKYNSKKHYYLTF